MAQLITHLIFFTMFVCLCHAVTDHEISAAIDAGLDNVGALMRELNVATQCGSCLDEVVDLLEQPRVDSTGFLASPSIYGIKKSANTLCLAD